MAKNHMKIFLTLLTIKEIESKPLNNTLYASGAHNIKDQQLKALSRMWRISHWWEFHQCIGYITPYSAGGNAKWRNLFWEIKRK